jgi:hypothetical protein
MVLVRSSIQRWIGFLCEAHWLRGVAVLRICFGAIVSSVYILHIRDREFLFGPSGLFPWRTAHDLSIAQHSLNLFAVNSSDLYFNLCFFAGIAVCLAFTCGLWSRVATPLFVIFTWSIFQRQPDLMDGGYRLLNIMLIYLIFAETGRYYSVDSMLAQRRGVPMKTGPFRAILHNAGVMACMYQVCVVYLFSTFYKVTGTEWQQGTALYYAMSDVQFNGGPWTDVLLSHPLLLTAGNYATLLYQSAFVWLIWHPWLKYPVIALALLFHLGIAVFIGLPWFSAIMISCEAIFLLDRDYERIGEMLERWFARGAARRAAVEQHA